MIMLLLLSLTATVRAVCSPTAPSNCKICDEKDTSVCVECSASFLPNNATLITECVPYTGDVTACATASSVKVCTGCDPGFLPDNFQDVQVCSPIHTEHCILALPTGCTACESGYYVGAGSLCNTIPNVSGGIVALIVIIVCLVTGVSVTLLIFYWPRLDDMIQQKRAERKAIKKGNHSV